MTYTAPLKLTLLIGILVAGCGSPKKWPEEQLASYDRVNIEENILLPSDDAKKILLRFKEAEWVQQPWLRLDSGKSANISFRDLAVAIPYYKPFIRREMGDYILRSGSLERRICRSYSYRKILGGSYWPNDRCENISKDFVNCVFLIAYQKKVELEVIGYERICGESSADRDKIIGSIIALGARIPPRMRN